MKKYAKIKPRLPGDHADYARVRWLASRRSPEVKAKHGQRGEFYGRVLRRYFGGAA